jgi:hypothetical protein
MGPETGYFTYKMVKLQETHYGIFQVWVSFETGKIHAVSTKYLISSHSPDQLQEKLNKLLSATQEPHILHKEDVIGLNEVDD